MTEDVWQDPDFKKFRLLQEELEFRRQQVDEAENKEKAEEKCLEVLKEAVSALERFNKRWAERLGPMPPIDDDMIRHARNKFAEMGIEITNDELREIIEEDDE